MLKPWFYNRLLYVIITTAISGYFNPDNHEPYSDRKQKYEDYLRKPIVKDALAANNMTGIGWKRRIILFFIRHRIFWILNLMGRVRKLQKEHM